MACELAGRLLGDLGAWERREQDDPPAARDPVRHTHRLPIQMEPQLAELAVQLRRVRLTQQRTFLSKQINVDAAICELPYRQLLQPLPNLLFKFNVYPTA